jgi:putrescine transport system substrate-binding protein
LLLKLRPHIAYFNSSKFISDLSNGNICVAVGWSGAMLEAKTNAEQAGNGVKIAYSLPKEGAPVWFDTLVLLKDAPHPAQGLAFIDYLLRAGSDRAGQRSFVLPERQSSGDCAGGRGDS